MSIANPHSMGGGLASDRTIKLMQLSKDCVMQHFGIEHESFGLQELDNSDDGAGHRNDVQTRIRIHLLIKVSIH